MGEKTGTIGGLLSPVLFFNNKDEFIKELNSVRAQTIVLKF